jgi:IS66 C-terminal element/Transposase IS66 family
MLASYTVTARPPGFVAPTWHPNRSGLLPISASMRIGRSLSDFIDLHSASSQRMFNIVRDANHPRMPYLRLDMRLDLCNNAVDRATRPLAIGRRNWTLAESDSGGDWASVMYTVIETAKLNGLDPEAYLRYVIAVIAHHPAKPIAELLPWNFTH